MGLFSGGLRGGEGDVVGDQRYPERESGFDRAIDHATHDVVDVPLQSLDGLVAQRELGV